MFLAKYKFSGIDMTKWELDSKVRRAASGGPRMFALLALPFIERYGDQAKFTKLAPRGDPYCEWFEEIED